MDQNEYFSRLVENAIDFLEQSLSEFEESPKYSVIHFYAAVELFLKARLMAEHWTLVVSKGKDPDWNKFESGDFISVTLNEAIVRLDKVIRSPLSEDEIRFFKKVGNHRNKMIHFFHEAESEEQASELLQSIAREQLNAWFYLHKILTTRWSSIFDNWSEKIEELNTELRKLHEYLQIVFDQIKPEIDELKANGVAFCICPSCSFESLEDNEEEEIVYETNCHVCRYEDKRLKITCPDCGEQVVFINEGFGQCEECDRKFEPNDLAGELIDASEIHIAFMDGDDSLDLGNCSDCDGYNTVIRHGDKYLCTGCFGLFENLERCEWCNEPNTGDMDSSYWAGCNFCDGKVGWDSDKDD